MAWLSLGFAILGDMFTNLASFCAGDLCQNASNFVRRSSRGQCGSSCLLSWGFGLDVAVLGGGMLDGGVDLSA